MKPFPEELLGIYELRKDSNQDSRLKSKNFSSAINEFACNCEYGDYNATINYLKTLGPATYENGTTNSLLDFFGYPALELNDMVLINNTNYVCIPFVVNVDGKKEMKTGVFENLLHGKWKKIEVNCNPQV